MSGSKAEQTYFVFDVQAIGVQGEAFWAGWCVVNAEGKQLAEGFACCPAHLAAGSRSDRLWAALNLPKPRPNCESPAEVRDRFWYAWLTWQRKGAVAAALAPFPIKAQIFLDGAREDPQRTAYLPSPIVDPSCFPCGLELDAKRRPGEMEVGDPLNDARYAARILAEVLRQADAQRAKAKDHDELVAEAGSASYMSGLSHIHAGPKPGTDITLPSPLELIHATRLMLAGWTPENPAHCPACEAFGQLLAAARDRFANPSPVPEMPMEEA